MAHQVPSAMFEFGPQSARNRTLTSYLLILMYEYPPSTTLAVSFKCSIKRLRQRGQRESDEAATASTMAFQMAGGVGLSGPRCGGEQVDVTTPWVSIIREGE